MAQRGLEVSVTSLEETLRALVAAEVARQLGQLRAANAPAGEQLVTVQAYAEARSISTSTVRAAIRDGRLEARRIGRALRVLATAEIAVPVRAPGRATAVAAAALGLRTVR